MFRADVSKKFKTALSSHDGALETSTTTAAPASAPARPSPVIVLTPVEGEAGNTSCPSSRKNLTTFFPISPLPPMTTIFMIGRGARVEGRGPENTREDLREGRDGNRRAL